MAPVSMALLARHANQSAAHGRFTFLKVFCTRSSSDPGRKSMRLNWSFSPAWVEQAGMRRQGQVAR